MENPLNTYNEELQLIECPRDAMQGWQKMISTESKINYINALLKVGFHSIDFGSFVSAKSIPQMADTKQVVEKLELQSSSTKLLAIVANLRGAKEAVVYDQITYLGFPFSLSETFQLRNTNSTLEESLKRVEQIQNLCIQKNRKLVIYLSMGFGNPYGDPYDESILIEWASHMVKKEISIISLADTVGLATPIQIKFALETLNEKYNNVVFGVHLHSRPDNWKEKFEAAVSAGCKRFDGALNGIGGCPMAQDNLVGNMNTENMIDFLQLNGKEININKNALNTCLKMAAQIFNQ